MGDDCALPNRAGFSVINRENNKAAASISLAAALVRPTGFEPAAFRVGELWHSAICNDTAREFVRCAQIPALFVVAIKECWNAKSDNQHRLKRKVVKWWSICGFRSLGVGRHYLCRAKFRHAWVSRHRAMRTEARSAAARAAARPGRPSRPWNR